MYCSSVERLAVNSTSKSVPPTATLEGVDARPLTARPAEAAVPKPTVSASQPAEPESPVEPAVRQLEREFKAQRFVFQPRFYLTDGWGCPDEVPVIGIPFYLGDDRLRRPGPDCVAAAESR